MAHETRPRKEIAKGAQLAKILRGAWRKTPPPPDFSMDEMVGALPDIKNGHLYGLLWWRIRGSALAQSERGAALRAEYVTQSLLAATGAHRVYSYVSALHAQGIDPIVFKGWSLLAHYAEAGLRSVGDVDLVVEPSEADRALEILKALGARPTQVDVHSGLADEAHAAFIPGAEWIDLFARARPRRIGEAEIRVLGAEEELQVICIHCMRHLAAQPKWLCDIAATIEGRTETMDWERCTSKPPYRSWILYAVLLAHHLLGADIENTPFAAHKEKLPDWLVYDVLRRWSVPQVPQVMVYDSILKLWRDPARWGEAVRLRLPNKLAVTLDYNGGLDERYLARYQARALWNQVTRFTRRNLQRDTRSTIS